MLTNKDSLNRAAACRSQVNVVPFAGSGIILQWGEAFGSCECPAWGWDGVEGAWEATGLGSAMPQSTSWWSCGPPQLLPLGVLVHMSSGEAQPLAAEGWGFLPPWSPRSMKSLTWSTSPVASGVAPGKFLFFMWKVSSQPLKWVVWLFGQFFYNTWMLM